MHEDNHTDSISNAEKLSDCYTDVSALWDKVEPNLYLEHSQQRQIETRLNKLIKCVVTINEPLTSPLVSPDEEVQRILDADEAAKITQKLCSTFIQLREDYTNRSQTNVNVAENLNTLIASTKRLEKLIKTNYELPPFNLPEHRERMKINEKPEIPEYPDYPDGFFNKGQIAELHNIRDHFKQVAIIDQWLKDQPDNIPAQAIKGLFTKHPTAMLVIGYNVDQSKQQIEEKVQAHFAKSQNAGVALFANAQGVERIEQAEHYMLNEIDCIAKCSQNDQRANSR